MSKPSYLGANVEVDTDTFASFVAKTNWIIDDMGKTVVTVGPVTDANTTNGAWSVGNAHIEGVLSTKVSAISELRGGTVANPDSINLSSNVVPKANSSPSIGISSNRIPNVFTVNTNILTLTANVATITTANVVTLDANTANVESLGANVATITDLSVTANTTTSMMHITGDLVVDGTTTFASDVSLAVNTSIITDLTVQSIAKMDGNTVIGNANTDSLIINAKLYSDLIPNGNTIFLGSAANQFKAFISNIGGTVSVNGSILVETAGVTRGGIVQDDANNRIIFRKYSNTGVYEADIRMDGGGVDDLKFLGYTVWHAGNDGAGSTLDADLLDGQQGSYYLAAASYTAADILTKIKTVDGVGSGLDADLLDGQSGSYYQDLTNSTGTLNKDRLPATLNDITVPSVTVSGTNSFARSIDNSVMNIFGGTFGNGANLELYGSTHATNANQAYYDAAQHNFRGTGGSGTPTFTIGGNTVWHAGNDGAGSGLDADLLDGQSSAYYRDLVNSTGTLPDARLSGAYTGITNFTMTGQLTVTNSAPIIRLQDTTSSAYDGRLRLDANNLYIDGSSDGTNYAEVLRFELDSKVGYMSQLFLGSSGEAIRLNAPTAGNDPYISYYVAGTRTGYIQYSDGSGNGQGFKFYNDVATGADTQLTLKNTGGVDGLEYGVGSSYYTVWHTGNLVSGDINSLYGYTPLNPSRNLTAGNGLTGGGNLTADRTFTLGTPSDITNSTTNSVTSTSHTHALGFVAAEVYTGSSNGTTTFGLGHTILMYTDGNTQARNSSAVPTLSSIDTVYYRLSGTSGAGTALSGTWRHHGQMSDNYMLMQRTA